MKRLITFRSGDEVKNSGLRCEAEVQSKVEEHLSCCKKLTQQPIVLQDGMLQTKLQPNQKKYTFLKSFQSVLFTGFIIQECSNKADSYLLIYFIP